MLIEFSVENYRSIKERQTLSMVAVNSKKENCYVLNTGFNAAENLTENAAIYGPNGAGKTNLILAMEFFKEFIVESFKDKQKGESIKVEPFLFSKKTQQKSSTFKIIFVHENFLFQYGFTADSEKVHDEWLYATPKGKQKQKTQTWFERNSKEPIKKELKGDKAVWLRATRDNALFLSTAVQHNSEDFEKPFNWIKDQLHILTNPELLHPNFTISQIHKNGQKEKILNFMKGLDAPFEDIITLENEFDVFTTHKTENENYYSLPLEKESNGTKRLFTLAGYIIDALNNGNTLIIDDFDSNIHFLVLEEIISLFGNERLNKNNAQLIFTAHNTELMNILSKGRTWLMDRNKYGESKLLSVAEFIGKRNDNIKNNYLIGRYGALPIINRLI